MTALRPLGRALVLAAILLSSASAARADDEADAAAAEEARPKTDLMDVMRCTRVGQWLDCRDIKVKGWVEMSLSTTPGLEADRRTARVFDYEADGFRLHQAYLSIEKTPAEACCATFGGKVAVVWGTDAALVHAHGLLDDQDGDVEQFDLLEAKVLVRFPVAHGLTVSAGKCTTPLGFEVFEAANNLLPSRSFLFGYAVPVTHTGVIATLETSDRVKWSLGAVEGWDVWDDVNDAWSGLGSFSWTSESKADALVVNGILGAERPGNDDDLRGVLDATWSHTWSECWSTALNADYGFEEGAAPDGGDATWWGAAGYLTRKWSDALSGTVRAEYFRDAEGTRLGTEASLSELTVGLDWKPNPCLPNLHLRPEVRWDHSFDGPFFDDGTDDDQVSLVLNVVFTF